MWEDYEANRSSKWYVIYLIDLLAALGWRLLHESFSLHVLLATQGFGLDDLRVLSFTVTSHVPLFIGTLALLAAGR